MNAKDFYNVTADNYDKRHDNPTAKYMRSFEEKLLKKYAKGKILDVGCGTGEHLALLENAIGLDLSIGMMKKAKNKTNKPVVQAKAEALPFPGNSFDSIICMFTVLNLCDFDKAVKEMQRVLKKNGIAVASVASVWDRYDRNILKRMRDTRSKNKKVRIEGKKLGFRLFSKKDFIRLFENSGFKIVKFDSIFILQKPYWGWYRNFTTAEKARLMLERVLPKHAGRMYFAVFKKA